MNTQKNKRRNIDVETWSIGSPCPYCCTEEADRDPERIPKKQCPHCDGTGWHTQTVPKWMRIQ
jgi:hypothetical protein